MNSTATESGDSAGSLTAQQAAQFWDDGFLVIDDVFSAAEVESFRAACSAPEDRAWETATETVHSLGLTGRHPVLLDLARDPRLVSKLMPLIGEDIQLQHSKLAAKPLSSTSGEFGWHQDFAYFPHTNTSLIAIMIMLDDSTPMNGCMSMVRGSHKLGLRDHSVGGYFVGSCVEKSLWEASPDQVIPITPRTGGISMHHCLTLHGSPPNLSSKPRRGIVFQYRANDAYQLADTIFDDTGLVIHGQRREQVRCATATYRLPKVPNRQPNCFGAAWNQAGPFAERVNREAGV